MNGRDITNYKSLIRTEPLTLWEVLVAKMVWRFNQWESLDDARYECFVDPSKSRINELMRRYWNEKKLCENPVKLPKQRVHRRR